MHLITVAQTISITAQLAISITLLYMGYGIVALAWTIVVAQILTAIQEVIGSRHMHLWRPFYFEWGAAFRLFPASFDFFLTFLSVVVFSRLGVLGTVPVGR